jgi:hypothetical protein
VVQAGSIGQITVHKPGPAPRALAGLPPAPAGFTGRQIADQLKNTIARLEEALVLEDRNRWGGRLRALRQAHRTSLSSDDNKAIRALLRRAKTS